LLIDTHTLGPIETKDVLRKWYGLSPSALLWEKRGRWLTLPTGGSCIVYYLWGNCGRVFNGARLITPPRFAAYASIFQAEWCVWVEVGWV
jgi:hypothetical protein